MNKYEYKNAELDQKVKDFMKKLDLNTQGLGQDHIRVLVDQADKIISCAFIQPDFDSCSAEIFVFGVALDLQRTGVGRFFAGKILKELTDGGCERVNVEPNSKKAYSFWSAMGFCDHEYLVGNYGFHKMIKNL